jgi:hypothetical protein
LAIAASIRETSIGALDPHMLRRAAELQALVAAERARKQPRFAQDLKAVAGPENRAASSDVPPNCRHYR